jgi:hypothetical protein
MLFGPEAWDDGLPRADEAGNTADPHADTPSPSPPDDPTHPDGP